VRPQLSICPYPCSLVFTVTSRCSSTRLLACFIFRFQNESHCSLGCTSPPRHAKAVIRDPCLLTCTAIVPKSRKVAPLSRDVMLLDQMLMAPFSCFLYRGVHDAGAYCNLSRSYRGLVFRVTVPCGRQGHILEAMERKRTMLPRVEFKRGGLGNGSETRSNKRPSYSMLFLVLVPPKATLWPFALFLPASKCWMMGMWRRASTLRTLRDECGYRRSSRFKRR
jgi:hypothetical protein